MASMTDIIEKFIKDLMKDCDNIQIHRNELASVFSCAPSQINYVLVTRFTLEKGYYINSKKGGGGYVNIYRINKLNNNYIKKNIYDSIGSEVSFTQGKKILNQLLNLNLINKKELIIVLCAIDDKSLNTPILGLKDKLRSKILKNIIEGLFNIEE